MPRSIKGLKFSSLSHLVLFASARLDLLPLRLSLSPWFVAIFVEDDHVVNCSAQGSISLEFNHRTCTVNAIFVIWCLDLCFFQLVLCTSSSFVIVCGQNAFMIILKHLFWKAFSFLVSAIVNFQVSYTHKSTNLFNNLKKFNLNLNSAFTYFTLYLLSYLL